MTGQAIYQLDVTADGRYVADGDGPKEVNGYFMLRTATGDAPNPLWQFDATVDLLPVPPDSTTPEKVYLHARKVSRKCTHGVSGSAAPAFSDNSTAGDG